MPRLDVLLRHTANRLALTFFAPSKLQDRDFALFLFSLFFFFSSCGAATINYPCVAWSILLSHNEPKCQWQHRSIISKLHLISSACALVCFFAFPWRNKDPSSVSALVHAWGRTYPLMIESSKLLIPRGLGIAVSHVPIIGSEQTC